MNWVCPHCGDAIQTRQVTCRDCYDPGTQCRCGAALPMGPYGVPYSCCEECAGDQEPDGEDIFRDYRAEERDAQEAARRLK